MPADHDTCMRIALEEAERAGTEGNAAVGSVIMIGDLVAKGRNIVTTTIDPTTHAETVVIREAGRQSAMGT